MNALMRGLNHVYDREESRGFARQRLTALGMLACLLLAFGLAFGLLVLGPKLSDWLGSALDAEDIFGWLWWTLQWPILISRAVGRLRRHPLPRPRRRLRRWSFLTPGAIVAVIVWLLASGLFAVYVSLFGSYNKAWGSLAGVIIMLVALALGARAPAGRRGQHVADQGGDRLQAKPDEGRLSPNAGVAGRPGYTRARAP